MEKKKINVVGLVFLLLGIAVVVLSSVFGTQLYSELSVFNNNPTGNLYVDTLFHKIPSVIKSIEIITIAYLIHLLFKVILGRIFFKNKRGKTIVKLLASFLKYLIAIISIFCVLGAFGVDGVTLLASAGVLGLIIGLGAQSLIADVIAGIFIVFEADFEVGDIVVIDDWRGTVKEIGIRTTKIEDYGGNVKIVNNSQISTIVNQTKELSLARTELLINNNINIIQMPCAESSFNDNLIRNPAGLSKYNNNEFNNHCEILAENTAKQIKNVINSGYKIIAILGIEQSPSCCVNYIYTNHGNEKRKGLFIDKLAKKVQKYNIPIIGINRKYINKSLSQLNELIKNIH